MKTVTAFYGNIIHYCKNCNDIINSEYSTQFTDIEFFEPPYILCANSKNKAYFKPYSKISTLSKIKFWTNTLFFQLIIWFIAAPAFIIGFGSKMLMKEILYVGIYLALILISIVGGLFYIIYRNLTNIEKNESEHILTKDEYWES